MNALELALWFAKADDEVTDDEIESIVAIVKNATAMKDLSAKLARRTLYEMERRYTTLEEVEARIHELAQSIHDPELQRHTFWIAALCASEEGEIPEEAQGFMHDVQKIFGFSNKEAREIITDALSDEEEDEEAEDDDDPWGDYPFPNRLALLCLSAANADGEISDEEFEATEEGLQQFLDDVEIQMSPKEVRRLLKRSLQDVEDEELVNETIALFYVNVPKETLVIVADLLEEVAGADDDQAEEEVEFVDMVRRSWRLGGCRRGARDRRGREERASGGGFFRKFIDEFKKGYREEGE